MIAAKHNGVVLSLWWTASPTIGDSRTRLNGDNRSRKNLTITESAPGKAAQTFNLIDNEFYNSL